MTTGKTIGLTFFGKVMSLLFNMLSRLVIAFLPRSKLAYWHASLYCASLDCTLQMLHFFSFIFFLQMEGLWQLCFEQVYCWHFFLPNSVYSLPISMSHFGNPHNISKNFYLLWLSVMLVLWLFWGTVNYTHIRCQT